MKKQSNAKTSREFIRIGRYLNEIVVVTDSLGNVLQNVTKPLMIEVYPRDVMQLIIGATLLSTPLALTEEVWRLGEVLPLYNIVLLMVLSMVFTSLFVYYNFYRQHLLSHWLEFVKRIVLIYIISLGVSFIMLHLFDKGLPGTPWLITLKRMVIIAFPASMSATVADMLK